MISHTASEKADHAHSSAETPDTGDVELEHLKHQIEHAAHYLPSQGPINVFVHHNTLHALEDETFDKAVIAGALRYNCQPYLSEDRYRDHLDSGRIQLADLESILRHDLGESGAKVIFGEYTRFAIRMAMVKYRLPVGTVAELRWLVAETDALLKFRPEVRRGVSTRVIDETRHWAMRDLNKGNAFPGSDQQVLHIARAALKDLLSRPGIGSIENWGESSWEAFCLQSLWRACRHGVHCVAPVGHAEPASLRPRDWLFEATATDADRPVNELLIRFCASFLDQGLAPWPLPNRDAGMYASFIQLYRRAPLMAPAWMRRVAEELERIAQAGLTPLESIRESLQDFGIHQRDREAFISSTLLSLRGWGGIIWQMETRGDRIVRPAPEGTLIEFLAIRLILDRAACLQVAQDTLGYLGLLRDLRASVKLPRHEQLGIDQRAFTVFQIAQLLGWRPIEMFKLTSEQWAKLVHEIDMFTPLERRRVLHQAYERRYYTTALDAMALHVAYRQEPKLVPRFQVMTCIDDREESFRRHLEEVAPDSQTFGAAGFFGVAMYYRGAAEAHYTPLCPIVVRPNHWVQENAVYALQHDDHRRAKTRRALGSASHRVHMGSRTFMGGVLVAILGSLASIPLIARVILPRFTAKLRKKLGRFVRPPEVTQLTLERTESPAHGDEPRLGYTVDEMTNIVEGLLRDIGLTKNFSRLFIALGHGSSSLNNPHESAYNCGACAGARGGPNARSLARMANDWRVRERLRPRGIVIPDETWFVGGYHNTCDDNVEYFDLDRLPPSHRIDFSHAKRDIDLTRQRNAQERCRRFESTSLKITPESALRHVEARAEDLAQSRPEYNHATNALCIVGRRKMTRGLFMDRRAFLTEYDPTQDDENATILARLLRAAIPVCAGISLEYYFSCVDPVGWGCGSKLPHNVTSLVGVMEGAASDLRSGLSAQMVEIHEPMRILFIIETTPAAMLAVMRGNETIDRLVRNEWVRLATIDPHTAKIQVFRHGEFELYTAESNELPAVVQSVDWFRGWRDHLGFASIRGGESQE